MPGIFLFNDDEVKAWEQEQLDKYWNTQVKRKRYFDPRVRKLNEFRNHRRTKHYYNHEVKWIRQLTQGRFRMQFKSNMLQEQFYKPVPHDYRTYGWLSY